MVKKLETSGVVGGTNLHYVPFTKEMGEHIRKLEDTINQHTYQVNEQQRGYNLMAETINMLQTEQGGHAQRLLTSEYHINGITERLTVQPTQPTQLNLKMAYGGGAAAAPGHGGAQGCGSSCGSPNGAWSSWQAPTPPGVPQEHPSGAGAGGGGVPLPVLHAIVGGNGECHCIHVRDLMAKVEALEARSTSGSNGSGDAGSGGDPWWSGQPMTIGGPAPQTSKKVSLPLDLKGPLGAIVFKDRAFLDEKLALQEDYRFNGTKGGLAWKGKVERHFISRAPILKEILEWAEACELQEIDPTIFAKAVVKKLDDEQAIIVNAALWGFLSAAVSGTAEAIFKGAGSLNGIDAWRRLVRFINHGKALRLETLRREVKLLHTKPISSLDKVEEGVAEWENVYREYKLAGGTMPQDPEMKADLLAVLPAELRETLLWKTTEEDVSYQQFRDHVLTQAGRVLMNRRKLPIHALDVEEPDGDDNGLADIIAAIHKLQHDGCEADLVAAIQRFQRGGGGRFQRRGPGGTSPPPPRPAEDRPPRKCPNCGKTHAGRCTAAQVSPADRPCWSCGKKGHVSRNCPDKKRENGAVKAIEDRRGDGVQACFNITDEEGFKTVAPRRRATATGRPMPRMPTLDDFIIDKNKFADLSTTDPLGSGARSRVPADEPVPAKPPQDRRHHTQWPVLQTGDFAGLACAEPGRVSADPLASLPMGRPGYRGASSRALGEREHPSGARSGSGDLRRAPAAETTNLASTDPLASLPVGRPGYRGASSRAFGEREHPSGARSGSADLRRALAEAQRQADGQIEHHIASDVNVIYDEEEDPTIAAVAERVAIRPAMDSGSVANVLHPSDLPAGAVPSPNTTGRHFAGARGGRIERFGSCETLLEGEHGAVSCNWQLADVTRPLHSVGQVTGPEDGPPKTDVLFNNQKCVVVPPGVVEEILKKVKPIAEYKREGNLYLADMTMSVFGRQGQAP